MRFAMTVIARCTLLGIASDGRVAGLRRVWRRVCSRDAPLTTSNRTREKQQADAQEAVRDPVGSRSGSETQNWHDAASSSLMGTSLG